MIDLLVVILVAGVLLWAVQTYVPMAAPIKNIFTVVVILILMLYILQAFGLLGSLRRPLLR